MGEPPFIRSQYWHIAPHNTAGVRTVKINPSELEQDKYITRLNAARTALYELLQHNSDEMGDDLTYHASATWNMIKDVLRTDDQPD
jgi:hypothetical protein